MSNKFHAPPGRRFMSGGAGWEVVRDKFGARDVRPVGATSATVVHPRAKSAAKGKAIGLERAQRAADDFRKSWADNERALASKAPASAKPVARPAGPPKAVAAPKAAAKAVPASKPVARPAGPPKAVAVPKAAAKPVPASKPVARPAGPPKAVAAPKAAAKPVPASKPVARPAGPFKGR